MKYGKLAAMVLMVTFCSLFLLSSDSDSKSKSKKTEQVITISVPDIEIPELDLLDKLDVLSELDLHLEGLEERVSDLVEMELGQLDLDVHLEGIEERLAPLGELDGLVELECLHALEDLDLGTELTDFFDDFNWNDFIFDFDWDWEIDPDSDWD